MDCLICFGRIEGKFLTCADTSCKAKICIDCGSRFVEFSCKERKMLVCPRDSCDAIYLPSEITKLSTKLLSDYYHLCVSHAMNENRDALDMAENSKKIVERLRDERVLFAKTFPKAIQSVIDIALKSHMNKVSKKNQVKMESVLTIQNCFSVLCSGQLNSKFQCNTCETMYCEKCEKKKTDRNHTCTQEDLESMKFVKDLIKCPTCKFPIMKSYGCNFMTCSGCSTNFLYTTGEKTKDGNHNAHPKFTIENAETPSVRFRDDYSPMILSLFREIEKKKPIFDTNTLLKEIEKYKQNPTPKLAKTVAMLYEKYYNNKTNHKKYYKCMTEIEELHARREITTSKLNDILQLF